MPPAVVLVGPPASGKTTVGRELAAKLGMEFRDSDHDVAARFGMPVAEVFVVHGEARFREVEADVVAEALADFQGVLAVGSGAVLPSATRQLLADQFVVWLRLTGPVAAKRAGITGARPMQLGNLRSQWSRLMADREPMYAEVADLIVDTDIADADAEAVAGQIKAEHLKTRPRIRGRWHDEQ